MYLIVGLGNPGQDYTKTRHNMGFDTIDKIAKEYEIEINESGFKGLYGIGKIEDEKVILLKPQTYMNLSGESIKEISQYYKIQPENILVIYDDVDIQTGIIKIRKKGGPGTHNGMKSIVNELATEQFPRIRIGTGQTDKIDDMVDYVIGKINIDEYDKLEVGIDKAVEAVGEITKNGIDSAMNKFN